MAGELPRVAITDRYAALNETLVDLVGYIPDDKLEWSPNEDQWDLRHIFAHIAYARFGWTGNFITQKITPEEIYAPTATKTGIVETLRTSWERVLRFASDEANLNQRFTGETNGQPFDYTGHWIYFHLLEHDIHHRADIFHYLALLGVEHPQVETP